ncbi:aminopeptidase P family protein [Paraclostridium sordellii]|uniref:aminopeptidase P family protein n=1 Tax=Paraclostridium sordellii TaxID=1505 RepID=UPI0005E854D5|nr:aminopeptidase P family protein [Paeniclostridium sordellii]AUN14589.1 Xaa-Pro aminopeptidase [Paeniclostridium sordellii]MBS6024613.1 aminopeptidase P family protein [Paeniclostridium sordellii]MRZ79147.1 M24 family metallopeptidase [Paeniclostridium sordellii]MSB60017.1 M24 family metallopeptidase [Paeniclostridium sordellii]CEN90337.1 Xaa-pro aminopeptidase [[Clostridium] sordellii] [Paeniclostridium sordellii]
MFESNRKNLVNNMKENSLLIMFAGDAPYRSADQKYKFTPNRNFYYLTGINDTKVILTILKTEKEVVETIFVQREDELMAKWIGRAISKNEASEVSKIKTIKYLDEFDSIVSSYINRLGINKIYLDLERQSMDIPSTQSQDMANILRIKYPYLKIKNIYPKIIKLRTVKNDYELEKIKKAIDITKSGIEAMAKNIKPNMHEYEVEAYFDFEIKRLGASSHAFNTICASGKNATVLHYEDNNQVMKDGDLILFDLGAEFDYYCADISRTIPVNGKFTDRQKQIYSIVLLALKAVEEEAKPGLTLKDLNDVAKKVLSKGCMDIGLIDKEEELSKYYFHSVSHSLGLDTHDVWSADNKLEKGAIITNEPGLYIEEEGIGIRLENDLLIVEDGCINLSKHIPIEIDDIENLMN